MVKFKLGRFLEANGQVSTRYVSIIFLVTEGRRDNIASRVISNSRIRLVNSSLFNWISWIKSDHITIDERYHLNINFLQNIPSADSPTLRFLPSI